MPWTTPTLRRVREMVRDDVSAALSGAIAVGNNVLRVMSDAMAGLAHLNLRYLDWLALQLLPDTAETEWLDRHGNIWLVNADDSIGRKAPTYAEGVVTFTGLEDSIIPVNSVLNGPDNIGFETLEEMVFSSTETVDCPVRALDPGSFGNLLAGTSLNLVADFTGVNSGGFVTADMSGGADVESDDDLRTRVLLRIQQPPMGGDATDYVQWALGFAGVTRAWSYPLEMGIGTVTTRFMMDDLRSSNDGFPLPADVEDLTEYLDTVRPVAVKDRFVVAPIPFPIDFTVSDLDSDDVTTRANIETEVEKMLLAKASPGQTVHRSWIDEAISSAVGESSHELTFTTTVMPGNGYLPVLGTVSYS